MSKGMNRAIGAIVGIIFGLVYYLIVWEWLFRDWFGYDTTWYVPLFAIALAILIGMNFGKEFGFDSSDHLYNLLYLLEAIGYVTLLCVILLLLVWLVTNPFARFWLICAFVITLAPAGKLVLVIFFRD